MNSYKKSVKIFLSFIGLFIVINALIWNISIKQLFYGNKENITGELCRLGYTLKGIAPRKTYVDLKKQHFQYWDYSNDKNVDVITIGDSFSNESAGGKNPHYQDYIATYNNLDVMNIAIDFDAPEQYKVNNAYVVIGLINNGFFDKVKPKYVIYQSVERHAIERFGQDLDYSFVISPKNPLTIPKAEEKIKFINIANLKYIINSILYNFSDNAFFSQAYMEKLSKKLFNTKEENIALFFYKDLNRIKNSTDEKVQLLNDNLNIIADKLARKGIKFYFMPSVDKYNLYEPYIINNKHPKSVFFEKLRPLKKRYNLIDTKEILSKELGKGEKDIYYSDDTHWSYKASESIFKNCKF